jgi:hypothetical protein
VYDRGSRPAWAVGEICLAAQGTLPGRRLGRAGACQPRTTVARRLGDADRGRILELAGGRFAGANDSHLVDFLADEGLIVSRATVHRTLRAAGRPSPRHRRPPRHRSRRDRMAQAGLLLQLDGSRHDWLESRGPRLTLVGAIDEVTGILTGATFRDQEDVAQDPRLAAVRPSSS